MRSTTLLLPTLGTGRNLIHFPPSHTSDVEQQYTDSRELSLHDFLIPSQFVNIHRCARGYGLRRRQVSLVVKKTIGMSKSLTKRRQIHERQIYQSNQSRSQETWLSKQFVCFQGISSDSEKDLKIMGDDSFFIFPAFELRVIYISAT